MASLEQRVPRKVLQSLLSLGWQDGQTLNSKEEWIKVREHSGLKAWEYGWRSVAANLINHLQEAGVILRDKKPHYFTVVNSARLGVYAEPQTPAGVIPVEGLKPLQDGRVIVSKAHAIDMMIAGLLDFEHCNTLPQDMAEVPATEAVISASEAAGVHLYLTKAQALALVEAGELRFQQVKD